MKHFFTNYLFCHNNTYIRYKPNKKKSILSGFKAFILQRWIIYYKTYRTATKPP